MKQHTRAKKMDEREQGETAVRKKLAGRKKKAGEKIYPVLGPRVRQQAAEVI